MTASSPGKLCPICRIAEFEPVDYEGVGVLQCGNCHGYWVTKGQLQEIVCRRVMQFPDEAKRQFKLRGEPQAVPDKEFSRDLVCPECGKALSIDRYAGDSPIIINRCPTHGVWLDRLEVEWIQMIVEGFDV